MSGRERDEEASGQFAGLGNEELARAAKAGDRAARNALFMRLQPDVRARSFEVKRRVGRSDGGPIEPEDVDQQAFIIFCELLEEWEPGRLRFASYLRAKVGWRILHYVRGTLHYRARVKTVRFDGEREKVEAQPGGEEAQAPVEEKIGWEERTEGLDRRWREVLRQRFEEELSSKEIAALGGRSSRTVNRDLRTALRLVRERVEEEWEGCG